MNHPSLSATANWRPFSWFTVRANTGYDLVSTNTDLYIAPGEAPVETQGGLGERSNSNVTLGTLSTDVGATATWEPIRLFSSRTSIGAQYVNSVSRGADAAGSELPPGVQDVNGAAHQTTGEFNDQSIVVGSYVEEALAVDDRLFLTGAGRFDGASSFGSGVRAVFYPKVSASWLVSNESLWPKIPGVSSLRLRAAYGEAGVQPPSSAAVASVTVFQAIADGVPASAARISQLANPQLRPETQREFEAGADLALWRDRVQIGATYYFKKSANA